MKIESQIKVRVLNCRFVGDHPEATFSLGKKFGRTKIKIKTKYYQEKVHRKKYKVRTNRRGQFRVPILPNSYKLRVKIYFILCKDCVRVYYKGRAECQIYDCKDLIWRTFDGNANNLLNPALGCSNTALTRTSPVDYKNGTDSLAVRGTKNPNPRIISNYLCSQTEPELNKSNLTNTFWEWGQFLDHEIDLTPDNSGESANIITPSQEEDPNEQYPNRVIPFHRSGFLKGSSNGPVRQQPNIISSFIDATNVYGFDATRSLNLRSLDGTGKLKTIDQNEILPMLNTVGGVNANPTHLPEEELFLVGDIRGNENVFLTGFHTIFVREHNRLCEKILNENPDWEGKDELIYQKARRYVSGLMQQITYSEFLPLLLGPNSIPEYKGYDDQVNPSIATEFSTSAYRFGHSCVSEQIHGLDLRDLFFNPSFVKENGIDAAIVESTKSLMQEVDIKIVDALRNFLFESPTPTMMLDLASLNIQRGRDHGLCGYNKLREAYGLSPVTSFDQITSDPVLVEKLEYLYDSPDTVDPWVGGLLEEHVEGAQVGELNHAIIRDQFIRLRDGDSFWFENDSSLSESELNEIKLTKLGDVIRRNVSSSYQVPDNVFVLN